MFLLDTNVVSELRKASDGRADAGVVVWTSDLPPKSLFISVISLMELEIGVLRIERRDETQGRMLRSWLDERVLPFFEDRILPVDDDVAVRCARLHVPDNKSERDALIAATALSHGLTISTRNEKDFRDIDVPVVNPWASGSGSKD